MANYTVYHLHTEYSLLDSCTNYKDYIDKAVSLGQKSIGFSEHGNLYGWANKYFYCKEKGIKYLHGIEVYLTETLDEKIRDNYHTVLIAKNQEGFKEINYLYFLSTREDHVYYKPRLTFDEFLNISDNVIKISACVQSPLNKYMLKIKDNYTTNQVEVLDKLLKHYDYYEIQYHNMAEQIEFNQYLYRMSQRYNKPLIVGTDTHSLNSYKAECRVMLQYGKSDGAWGDAENECDLTYKTYDEIIELFRTQNSIPMDAVLEALDNTNKMADSIDVLEFDTHDKYPLLYGDKDEEVFWDMLRKKYIEKVQRGEIDPNNPRYAEDIKEEMRVFKKINMIGFMLFMAEVMTWARENGIATGFSRGSVGGSTVAYMSDITDIDPIKWNTVFSRFANEYRVEAGDIDTDWYEDDRQKVYDYIIDRFGLDKTAYILAVGTLADKAVIDTIGKAFRVRYGDSTPYTLSKIKEIKKEYDSDPQRTREKYSDLFYYYDGLKGCIVSQSQHPAGIIVSPITLADNFGMFYGKDGQQILPIDMEECHEMGLIKFDILGLKSVGVIDKTFKLIGKKFPRAYEVDWEDQAVFNDITKDSTAIFQFESDFGRQSIRKMKPKSVDDICLCSACLRPSGESYREQVYARQWNKNPSKLIDDILANSYGFLCIDEDQLMPTTNGIKKIKDIVVGDNIYTHNGISKVNCVYNNGIKNVYKVTTPNGNIICTDNHKILTQCGWVELKDIMNNPNDYCIAIKVNDCGINDYNKDLLKILAWLIGDGILHQSDTQRNHLGFVNTNIDIINDFCNSINNVYGNLLTTSVTERKTRVNKYPIYYVNVNWKQPYVMRGTEKPIVTFLKECNIFDHLAQDKELPSFLFNLNRECILTFLGAYTDTDCHVDENAITYHCASYNLLLGIQELYRQIGFSSCLKENNNGKDFTLSITNAKNALCELRNYSIIIRQNGLGLEHNKNNMAKLLPKNYVTNNIITNGQKVFTLEDKNVNIINNKYVGIDFLKRIKSNNKYSDIIQFNEYTSDENINWAKIKSIELVGEKNVYDLEIDNTHDFALCGGLIVHNCYQEQTIAFLQQVCGFSGSEADNIRRAIGKKQREKIDKALPQILEGYCEKSDKDRATAEAEAKQFIKVIEDASGYSFGFNHSESYAMLGYLMGWLRYYYPTEFCTSYLNCAKNDEDLANGQVLAQSRGVKIQKPIFRYSTSEYGCDAENKTIYKGIGSIKNIGTACGNNLNTLKDNHYDTFIDLLYDISKGSLANKTELVLLIMIDFFREFGDINYLLACYGVFLKLGKRCSLTLKDLNTYNLTREQVEPFCEKATEKQFRGVNMREIIKLICNNIEYTPITDGTKMLYEVAILGYTDIITECDDRLYIVSNKETNQYGTTFVTMYHCCDGQYVQYKVKRWAYNDMPCDVGDALLCYIKEQNKVTKVINENDEEEWVTTDVTEVVIQDYALVKKFEIPFKDKK